LGASASASLRDGENAVLFNPHKLVSCSVEYKYFNTAFQN